MWNLAWAQETVAAAVPASADEVSLGAYSLPVILVVFLGIVFKIVGEERIPDRVRPLVAVLLGWGLGILAMFYQGHPPDIVHLVDYSLYGIMSGAGAIGLHELQKSAKKPSVA